MKWRFSICRLFSRSLQKSFGSSTIDQNLCEERESLEFSVDLEVIKIAKEIKYYPHEFKSLVLRIKRGKNASKISFASSFLTSLVFKMFLNFEKSENLEKEYRKAKIIRIILLLFPWIFLIFLLQGIAYIFLSTTAKGFFIF